MGMTLAQFDLLGDETVHELYLAHGMPDHPIIMTGTQVAKVFVVDPKTVTRWAVNGDLHTFRTPGNHRRYHRAEIERRVLRGMIESEIYVKAMEIISG
jgi:hypothetical protein